MGKEEKTPFPLSIFVSEKDVHPYEITLPDGSVHTFFFRDLTTKEWRRIHLAETNKDENISASSNALMISFSLCDEHGHSVMTPEKAATLKGDVAGQMVQAILKINRLTSDEDPQKNA